MIWLLIIATVLTMLYLRAPLLLWAVVSAAGVAVGIAFPQAVSTPAHIVMIIAAAGIIPLSITGIRKSFLSKPIFDLYKKVLPPMSQTEKEALDAGTVWWDGELFTGAPDWNKLKNMKLPELSQEEIDFINGPTEELCKMINDWEITHERADLPPEVWKYMKDQGFLGMIIPKKYGGKEYSALCHSTVVMKLSTRSTSAAVSVMVPNSLGPAELLLKYGTEEQKDHYLPRLADGREVPCFALTAPSAGSDAGAIPDRGIVCEQEWNGKKTLGLRVTWDKRYITLGPIATVLGLAFKVYDPDHLLSDVEERGITCALIPTNTPGVEIGKRHFPMNATFMNGPNWGNDVFIPMDYLIGGQERIGQGWAMLVSCLSVGRSISLPALGTGASKVAAQATGAYSRIRKQFKTPIGKFEGVEEALQRIAGNAYMMEGARKFTACAVDLGEKPAVPSAIVKYHLTERMRDCIDDAMDVHGGRGICMGPRNYLGRAYQAVPISITVEGANILTRSMMIFGQGAIRCHPYLLKEMEAAMGDNYQEGLASFDKAFFGHLGFVASNKVRAFVLGLTHGLVAGAPSSPAKRHYQHLSRFAAAFAFVADVAMLILGGELKRREKLSGRFADLLSYLYLGSATLKRFEDDGCPAEDRVLLDFAMQDLFFRMQNTLEEILDNYPIGWVGKAMKLTVFPLGHRFSAPSDKLGHKAASLLLEPSATRDRLIKGMYINLEDDDPIGRLEITLEKVLKADPLEAKVNKAIRKGELSVPVLGDKIACAVEAGVITNEEAAIIRDAHAATADVEKVDHFDHADLARTHVEDAQINDAA